jgi:hypothetical protein
MSEKEWPEDIRFPPNCFMMENPEEIGEGGWREALVSGGAHLARALNEYRELDFECLLQELDAAGLEGCTECYKVGGERMYRVYVRPVKEKG